MLEILHQTSELVAIDKPSGLLVHRTRLASGESDNCVARLRDQLGQWVYPVHRLDRATSGVLLFALSPETAEKLSHLYREGLITKRYLAVVRGFTLDEGVIDKPLRRNPDLKGSPYVEARTRYRRLAKSELPYAVGPYSTARYSLVEVQIETGRRHQIRRHMEKVSHPVIGDTVYGDGEHNRFVRETFDLKRLLLHASTVVFRNLGDQNDTVIRSHAINDFLKIAARLIPESATLSLLD